MIKTERLVLRPYNAARDRAEMRAMCADPAVMRFLLPVPNDAAYESMAVRMDGYLRDYGFTFWTVERRDDGAILGICGLKPGADDTPIEGEVEIGWRFGREHWRQGYAVEAAQACLDWTWANTQAPRVVAITVPDNSASWKLMEKLGMTRVVGGDFDHPAVPDGSPLKRHILYRIDRPARG